MPTPPVFQGVRVRLDFKQVDGFLGGCRFYVAYSGSAPTPANCTTLAGDVESQFNANMINQINTDWSLVEVDVLDLASDMGASGQWTGVDACTRAGDTLPASVAFNVEFNIARRYRGGKPRIYWPGGVDTDLADDSHWTTAYQGTMSTKTAAFFAGINALSIGSMGTLQHSNVSYYKGWDPSRAVTKDSGIFYPVKYRDSVVVDTVEGYAPKLEVSTQKRRRLATTY